VGLPTKQLGVLAGMLAAWGVGIALAFPLSVVMLAVLIVSVLALG
jgi:hypothetical protein